MKKKICLLGATSVGKTSLVSRYVHSIFSEKYLSTLGVKVDSKSLTVDDQQLDLIIWDIHGDEDCRPVFMNYLRGTAGYMLIADGTRPETVDKACRLKAHIESKLENVPFIILLNKADLTDEWKVSDDMIEKLENQNWSVLRSSAKTGEGVEEAFTHLAGKLLNE